MSATNHRIWQDWMNDFLDLYNFAGSIGDREWQAELLDAMKDAGKHLQEDMNVAARKELRLRFEAINNRMMELFKKLRETDDPEEEDRYRDELRELRSQRIELAKRLTPKPIR